MSEEVKNGLAMKILSLIPEVSWKTSALIALGIGVLSIYAFPKDNTVAECKKEAQKASNRAMVVRNGEKEFVDACVHTVKLLPGAGMK